MKVKNITIENFRGVKEISIDLLDGLNVFVGINGSGKTTILETLAISLSWLINRIQRQNSSGSSISDIDIRHDSSYSAINIICKEGKSDVAWRLVKGAKGRNIEIKSELTQLSELAEHFQKVLDEDGHLPVIAYYPVTRVVNKISPEVKWKDNLYILDVYDNALGGQQNFHSFFEWFRLQDDIMNEKAVSRTKWVQQNKSLIKRQVNNILKLIKKTLSEDGFDSDEYKYLSERINKDDFLYEEPRFLFHEISRLIDFTNSKLRHEYDKIFHDLEYMFHKMEVYSRDYQDNLIASEGRYKDVVNRIIKDFYLLFVERNINPNITKVIWEVFVFANTLSLWWLSEGGRQNIEKTFKKSFSTLIAKKQDWEKISEQLVTSLDKILMKEIQQNKKKTEYVREGRELKFVTKAIEQFIPEYRSLRVKRLPRPHMLINKGKDEFNLNQLSDGEKNMITLVGDIARRLAIANPNNKNPLKGEGVILIDEIDLHLHPSWQRRMVPQLLETFPNCQFIISTHSPQVLSDVKPESLFLLSNENNILKFLKATESYGKNSDRILEDLLDVDARPTIIKERLKKLFILIEENKLAQAKEEIETLTKIIAGGDPELVKASVLIKRKEIIGK